MERPPSTVPDHTAVRVALWRALHAEIDSSPLVFDDQFGLKLVGVDDSWKQRPDMNPQWTRGYRAAIVARARYVEDVVEEKLQQGVRQYVIMGAGLDTFVQRKPQIASQMQVFEIDKPATQDWKRQRLTELGFGVPKNLHLVPVDFEAGETWPQKLESSGFDTKQPAVLASTGVAMYLTKETNRSNLRQIASLPKGSTLVMSFMLALELMDPAERVELEKVQERAKAAGTPFLSFFHPKEILDMAREAGFSQVQHVSRADMVQRYFSNRSDGLLPATGEELLVAVK